MKNITLVQLLNLLNANESRELIQIVTNGHDWDDPYELVADCDLLEPFYNYAVTDLSVEMAYLDGDPVIRVGIEKNNIIPLRSQTG